MELVRWHACSTISQNAVLACGVSECRYRGSSGKEPLSGVVLECSLEEVVIEPQVRLEEDLEGRREGEG